MAEDRRDPSHPSRLSAFLARSGLQPRIAIVTGSGLGALADAVEIRAVAPLEDMTGVRIPPVPGHTLDVAVGSWNGIPVVLFRGRYHLYQGLTPEEVVRPVSALHGSGVERLLLLNAAGGLNPSFAVGDLMLVTDHLNLPGLAGVSPLIPPRSGQVNFVGMRDAYSTALRHRLFESSARTGVPLQSGVYAMVAGPSYETAAELRMLRALGADAVGMSTAIEVVMARSLGLEVAGISVITNRALPDEESTPNHDEVLAASKIAVARLQSIVGDFLQTAV